MVYEFCGKDTCDEFEFATTMLVERYDLGLSIDSQCVSKYIDTNKKYQDNEVTVFLTHEQAIELRNYLNEMYK